MNITYKCNNACIYCISETTKTHCFNIENALEIIKKVDKKFLFSQNDIFIVNGGEPTLVENFIDIINFLKLKKCKINIYTNGRKLNNNKIKKLLNDSNIRWIVPFYGLEANHKKYTGKINSFSDTYNSIFQLTKHERKNICLKFLIKEKEQIADFEKLLEMLKWDNEIHISLILDNNIQERIQLTTHLQVFIDKLITDRGSLKVSNIPLCFLSKRIKTILKNYDFNVEDHINKYYFIDINETYPIEYDCIHKWIENCNKCEFINYCPDNCKKYRALKLTLNNVCLVQE